MKVGLTVGDSPLILAQPHGGIEVPSKILNRLNDKGRALEDTDWHISRLYDDLVNHVTVVRTPIHRYVIDANRDPSDQSLYPGQKTTSLCPTTTFDGNPIYMQGEEPGEDEIGERLRLYHAPYHDTLLAQLDRVHQNHGYALLYDCHSIRSSISYLFDGKLPDFNIGTNSGQSCAAAIEATVVDICTAQTRYSHVVNGRFKGGWTTRHYGHPQFGYHAIQMELSQCSYMFEKAPWDYDAAAAEPLRTVLHDILQGILNFAG